MPVPHVGHTPLRAGRPFFILTSTASAISLFALHFTQYASAILLPFFCTFYRPYVPGGVALPRTMKSPASYQFDLMPSSRKQFVGLWLSGLAACSNYFCRLVGACTHESAIEVTAARKPGRIPRHRLLIAVGATVELEHHAPLHRSISKLRLAFFCEKW